MRPPKEFVAKLHRYDPDLRLRWGVRAGNWIIERKLDERSKQLMSERQNPWKSDKGKDLYDGWREGYVHVLTVHPSLLDERVFEHLAESDTWRVGGMAKFNAKLDALQAAEEGQDDRAIKNWHESAAREAYDRLAWLDGRRVALSTPEPRYIDTGLGFVVQDRRRDLFDIDIWCVTPLEPNKWRIEKAYST